MKSLPNLRGTDTKQTQNHDRISDMPDFILLHILSFLPTKDSVKTCVLSRKWEFLWARVPALSFTAPDNLRSIYARKFVRCVYETLMFHRCENLKRFSVNFEYHSRDANDVNVWVRVATTDRVQELCLDLKGPKQCTLNEGRLEHLHKLPIHMYNNSTITKLGLSLCSLALGCDRLIYWNSLKSLSIGYTKLSEDLIANIMLGCPVLEFLELYMFFGIDRLAMISQSLRKLVVRDYWDSTNGSDESVLEISGPLLQSLEISGNMYSRSCKVTHLVSLVECSLNFRMTSGDNDEGKDCQVGHNVLRQLLQSVGHVKKLALGYWCFQVISMLDVKNVHFQLSKCNYLVLDSQMKKPDLFGIAGLLRSSPNLETLVIKVPSYYVHGFFYEFSEDLLSLEGVLLHLKNVKIIDIVTEPTVLEFFIPFAKFVLEDARVLEKMVITAQRFDNQLQRGYSHEELLRLEEKLLSLPRSSSSAKILFSK